MGQLAEGGWLVEGEVIATIDAQVFQRLNEGMGAVTHHSQTMEGSSA